MKKTILILSAVVMTAMMLSSCGGGGSQVWMAENLNVSTFRNGDPIPQAKTAKEWKAAGKNKQPAWCYFDNDPKNGEKYGKLYNFYAVTDSRGLAPKGFHVPSDEEWTKREEFLRTVVNGGSGFVDGGGGFSGFRFRTSDGFFPEFDAQSDSYGYWWSSTENSTDQAYYRAVGGTSCIGDRDVSSKECGFSVRCLRD